ncbi:caspase family protein [Pelomonas sp. APW6]|uniref:Caspase family protein n=1 Tax=Roseateles subflavus TaxID=3053353 RepID=A0ABT7LDV7_9BURK|nr:polysaccharide deacetylase family protein [Pelomonas sp. APW6]MDL5031041.1 caspase family protein [Pelomonas sp. APW6]
MSSVTTPWRRRLLAGLLLTAGLTLSACQRPGAPNAGPALSASAAASAAQTSPSLTAKADALLALHRQMVVLMDGEAALKPAEREAVSSVGLMLFHDLQKGQRALVEQAFAKDASLDALAQLLDRIESEPSWFDADRLAFKDLLLQLQQRLGASQSIAGLKLAKRAQEDLAVLSEVEQAYERELRDTFGRFAQRGIELKREKWTDYVAKLKTIYHREQILKDYATILPSVQAKPSAGKSERELFGQQLPEKTVLLSFDDGPHGRYTDEILEILQRYQAPAIFFELGQNLGSVDAQGQVKPGPGSDVARRVLAAGHQLANHSFTHGLMSKFAQEQVRDEAAHTEALLDKAGRSGQALFRFPYGARNDEALSTIESLKLRSMMWNIDSLDWSDPIPKSIAARVIGEVQKQQRGIVLFHDIHARTVQALPLVLDQLVAEGYKFASWKDGQFLSADRKPLDTGDTQLAGAALYRDSHALIIGIDQYQRWPRLQHAGRDAKAMQETLQTRFGFRPENVKLLLDGDATRSNILRALNKLSGKELKRDDRVFVFFAGHGSTRKLPSGREVGYVIPVDAGLDDLQTDAIAMPQLQELGEALPAKHALFVIDACYSGLGLTRGGGASNNNNFIRDNARRLGRQMMTAGGTDQQVADDGPGGHSVFTWTLLQALAGKADLNGDGLITATELAAYVAPAVSAVAHQTPAFGSLPGSEGGEFVFELAAAQEQALSSDSGQLDAQASALAKRLDEAKTAAQAPTAKAVQVKLQGLDGKEVAIAAPTAKVDPGARVAAQRANDRGLQLYKERRYEEAEAAFTEALKLQPRFALAANNLGFIYYKRGKPVEAARWYQKALEMDGSRSMAWLNLGDAQLQAGDDIAALVAYKSFVELAPQHPRTAELRAWIAQPDAAHRPKLPG